jgi:pimeloyl-ACP methyl ester carboxylesterase
MVPEGCARRGEVRVHYLDSDPTGGSGVPLLLSPGLTEAAEDYRELMASLAPRRCVAVTFRGRGRSGAPARGYALEDHVGDLEVVVAQARLGRFCLMGYSRGVAYAIAYALRHPDRLAGLILGDYPAHHGGLPPQWPDYMLATTHRGTPVAARMPEHAVRALQREARTVDFRDRLEAISCPVLVLRGGQEGSLLSAAEAEVYQRRLREVSIVILEDSGHELWEPNYASYVAAITTFLDHLDRMIDRG